MNPPARDVRVICAQLAPVLGDPAANRRIAREAIEQSLTLGGKVIVLPELMTTGYHLESDEAVDMAEDAQGPSLSGWVDALAGSDAIVVGGFCEAGADGRIYNSAALVTAAGVTAIYRKAHLWDLEPTIFAAGLDRPVVVETIWGPVGIAICYDLFFPEMVRTLALNGACLLAVPTNSPAGGARAAGAAPSPDGIGHVVARSAAYLNRVFIAVCDRHGDERGHSWTSRSSVIGPEGEFLAGPASYEAALLVADCNLPLAECKQWDGTRNDAFADRRPELYAPGFADTAGNSARGCDPHDSSNDRR